MQYSFQSIYLDSPLVRGRCFDIFESAEITCDTALFIVHGGGWRTGSRETFHAIMEAFNERGILCASTDYRLNVPSALEQLSDIRASYDRFITWLKENRHSLKVCVYGESAGAHLASLLLCAKPGECGENVSLKNLWVPPVKGVLQATPAEFTPWEDIFPHIWTNMQNIAGVPYEKEPERYEKLSLRNYIRKDNPLLFFAEAQNEHVFPSEKNYETVLQHRSWGIPSQWKRYRNVEHGFFYELKRWQQKEMFEDMVSFLRTGEVLPSVKNEVR